MSMSNFLILEQEYIVNYNINITIILSILCPLPCLSYALQFSGIENLNVKLIRCIQDKLSFPL